MKEIVFDTSTLILLAKVTILRKYMEIHKVIITENVMKEALAKETEDAKLINHLFQENILKNKINSQKMEKDFNIGKGEAEALAFAYENKIILATDDWKAIKACKILNVPFITAVHCFLHLYKKGKLEKKIAIEKLNNLEKYGRYNTIIIKDVKIVLAGEKNG